MVTNLLSSGKVRITLSAIFLTSFLTGCDVDGSNNLPRVPDVGLVMYAEANRHESQDTAQVAAAVFIDGEPVALVGGDVFEASTVSQRVLLTGGGRFDGSYAASLPVDDSVLDVFINVVHAPIEAREDRWYPIDIAITDPGPGELVGKSATVSFPTEVTINGPAADTVYTSINDVINLTWLEPRAGDTMAGDTMKVLSAVSCNDGLATSSYGTVLEIVVDDGWEDITLDNFIYDIDAGTPGITFIAEAALVLLQELLNKLSAGNIDPDFLARKVEANPISSTCEIRLFLQRQRIGTFDTTFDGGDVIGSRSREVTLKYIPPDIPVN